MYSALSAIMVARRKVDWHRLGESGDAALETA